MSDGPLIDRFGRVHRSLRISVTDRCNIRCQYCMPAETIRFLPKHHLLSFEEIARLVAVVAPLGLRRLRLTGGEPLVRQNLDRLVAALKATPQVEEVALTTNGILLAEQLPALAAAGLDRINISLDTLRPATFERLSRREGLDRVLAGIDAACEAGYQPRLNALVLRDLNLDEVDDLVRFAVDRQLTLRFIEFMPLDADRAWQQERVVSGEELRRRLERAFGPLVPIDKPHSAQPAQDWEIAGGRVGFIDPVSQPFCGDCDRLRLTAEGKIRNCLFGREEWDVRADLQTFQDRELDERIATRLRHALLAKHANHGIAQAEFRPPERAMYQIGG